MKKTLLSLAPLLLVFTSTSAFATPGDAMTKVKQGNERFRQLLAKKVNPHSDEEKKLTGQLVADMRTLFDIRDLGRRALIDHWEKLTPAQRETYLEALQQLIERAYVKQLRNNLKYEVDYLTEEPEEDHVVVKTVVHAEHRGKPRKTKVDYVLRYDADKWLVYDVITDNNGMIRNYRSQFNRIVTRSGFDALMDKMKKKLADDDVD